MPERTRSAPAAFGRGVSLVAANPGLLLAPLALGAASLAIFAAAGFAFLAAVGGAFAARFARLRRGPEGIRDLVESLQGDVLASPVAVLLVLAGVLVALLLLTALAAWLRAGVTGALVAADARAPEAGDLAAFRRPGLGRIFVESAGARFGAFFALVNLYGIAATFLVAVLLVPATLLVVALMTGHATLAALSGLALAVAIPAGMAGGAALRIVYLAAGRAAAVDGLDGLGAVVRAIALVKEIPGRAVTLYLLTVAGGMAVGLAFVFPRLALTFGAGAGGAGPFSFIGITFVFVLLQMFATLAYDAAITGAFVALWPQKAAAPETAAAPPPEEFSQAGFRA